MGSICINVPRGEPEPRAAPHSVRFHRRLPDYAVTPLRSLPRLAADIGVGALLVKDESARLGLPAFKVLGGSWAVYRLLEGVCGITLDDWLTFDDLKRLVADRLTARSVPRPHLFTATDGNHGRGVARTARWFGFDAGIFVPAGTARARIEAIQSENAVCTVVNGDFDDAVRAAADACDAARGWLIEDTSWPGYEQVPQWVIEGYSTIFEEIDRQLVEQDLPEPDLVVAPIGVGALCAAIVDHYRGGRARSPARIVGVEPESAACALASARVGRSVTVPGPHSSIMAGLNCGTIASIALPRLLAGVDAFLAIDDDRARWAMRMLAHHAVTSGETGCAGLAGLCELMCRRDELPETLRRVSESCVLIVNCEGITDPKAHRRIMMEPADSDGGNPER